MNIHSFKERIKKFCPLYEDFRNLNNLQKIHIDNTDQRIIFILKSVTNSLGAHTFL